MVLIMQVLRAISKANSFPVFWDWFKSGDVKEMPR